MAIPDDGQTTALAQAQRERHRAERAADKRWGSAVHAPALVAAWVDDRFGHPGAGLA